MSEMPRWRGLLSTQAHSIAVALIVAFAAGCEAGTTPEVDASVAPDAADTDADADADGTLDAADENVDASAPGSTDACLLAAAEPNNGPAVAACRAIEPFARGDFTEPFDLLAGDVSARRFRVAGLSGLWSLYQQALAQTPTAALRVYARVGDAAAQLTADELSTLTGFDAYTGPALHCREHPLPSDFGAVLADNVALGGYAATHALLALLWLGDRACPSPGGDTFLEATLTASAAVIDQDHSLTTDLEMEAAALLAYLGEAGRVPAGFVDGVVANQQDGGGWGPYAPTDPASGHTSALALWYLHELLFPGQRTPMVNPNVRTTTTFGR